jgi:hypothetical protein
MVTVAEPTVAELAAVNVAVTELPVVALDGLKATLTPDGSPVAAKLTAPVKLLRLIAMLVPALAPCATDTALAEPSVKSPAAVTLNETDVVRVSDPEVAVSVTVALPNVADDDALNVAVTELPVVAPDGLNATLTPLGNPEALKVTAPVKLVRVIDTEVEALAPRTTPSVVGEAATA